MEIASLVIASLLSGLAIVISVISLSITKRQVITNVVTNNRVEWINSVRENLIIFSAEYLGDDNKKELRIVKSKIELYMRNDANVYKALLLILTKCTDVSYNDEDYGKLISEAQIVLNKIWHRTKREAGIKSKEETKLKMALKEEFMKRNKSK